MMRYEIRAADQLVDLVQRYFKIPTPIARGIARESTAATSVITRSPRLVSWSQR